jgi:hypothetical protein
LERPLKAAKVVLQWVGNGEISQQAYIYKYSACLLLVITGKQISNKIQIVNAYLLSNLSQEIKQKKSQINQRPGNCHFQ